MPPLVDAVAQQRGAARADFVGSVRLAGAAATINEPLKMRGVETFGDYGIEIRMKLTTRPGEQFVIRRKALARIKQVFEKNGIRFAVPTVQVAGGDDAAPAAARQIVEQGQLAKPRVV